MLEMCIHCVKSLDITDCLEFRDLLLYIGAGVGLKDAQLPHRAKLASLVCQRFGSEYERIRNDLSVSQQHRKNRDSGN
jgi:hypothetical protein